MKRVFLITEDGKRLKVFPSIKAAAKALGVPATSLVPVIEEPRRGKNKRTPIDVIDLDGNIAFHAANKKAAGEFCGVSHTAICHALRYPDRRVAKKWYIRLAGENTTYEI